MTNQLGRVSRGHVRVCPCDLGLDSRGEGKAVQLHLPLGTCSPEDPVDKWILDWIADEAAAAI